MPQDRQDMISGGWMARWLPFACFTVAVSSTLSVLVLQAMTLNAGPAIALAKVPHYVVGWLGFTVLLAAATVAAVFRMCLLEARYFKGAAVQVVTLILMGALAGGNLVILLVNGSDWLWAGASMAMAAAGLVPLLAIRLGKRG